ncbi:hypothetical protein ACJJTC_000008 [Scirpophaga incertulas]
MLKIFCKSSVCSVVDTLQNIPCAGKFGLRRRNERGERLLQFAAKNYLVIANSLFQHHLRRLYTWISPDGKHRNQIDYFLIGSRWKTSLPTPPEKTLHMDIT